MPSRDVRVSEREREGEREREREKEKERKRERADIHIEREVDVCMCGMVREECLEGELEEDAGAGGLDNERARGVRRGHAPRHFPGNLLFFFS